MACVLKAAGFDRLQHSHLQLESPTPWNAHGLPHDNKHSVDVVLQSTSGCTRSFGHWLLLLARLDRNGLSVATQMDSEAPDQDCSRRSR